MSTATALRTLTKLGSVGSAGRGLVIAVLAVTVWLLSCLAGATAPGQENRVDSLSSLGIIGAIVISCAAVALNSVMRQNVAQKVATLDRLCALGATLGQRILIVVIETVLAVLIATGVGLLLYLATAQPVTRFFQDLGFIPAGAALELTATEVVLIALTTLMVALFGATRVFFETSTRHDSGGVSLAMQPGGQLLVCAGRIGYGLITAGFVVGSLFTIIGYVRYATNGGGGSGYGPSPVVDVVPLMAAGALVATPIRRTILWVIERTTPWRHAPVFRLAVADARQNSSITSAAAIIIGCHIAIMSGLPQAGTDSLAKQSLSRTLAGQHVTTGQAPDEPPTTDGTVTAWTVSAQLATPPRDGAPQVFQRGSATWSPTAEFAAISHPTTDTPALNSNTPDDTAGTAQSGSTSQMCAYFTSYWASIRQVTTSDSITMQHPTDGRTQDVPVCGIANVAGGLGMIHLVGDELREFVTETGEWTALTPATTPAASGTPGADWVAALPAGRAISDSGGSAGLEGILLAGGPALLCLVLLITSLHIASTKRAACLAQVAVIGASRLRVLAVTCGFVLVDVGLIFAAAVAAPLLAVHASNAHAARFLDGVTAPTGHYDAVGLVVTGCVVGGAIYSTVITARGLRHHS